MRKITILLTLMIFSSVFALAQNKARTILDQMANTINSYKSVSIDFEIEHNDHQNKTDDTQYGRIIAKGKDFRQFKVAMENSDVYCDGTTKWIFLKDVEEISITEADFDSDEMDDNPVKFFTVDRKDMKYNYKQTFIEQQKKIDEVDFYPKDRNAAYSIIRLHIEQANHHPKQVKYFGKDGNNYTIKVNKITPNITLQDEEFTFNVKNFPNAEVVDLR